MRRTYKKVHEINPVKPPWSLRNTRRVYPDPTQIENKTGLKQQGGWKVIELRGDAFERGRQHGMYLSAELGYLKRVFPNLIRRYYQVKFEEYMSKCAQVLPLRTFTKKWPEWTRELEGMVEGAKTKHTVITLDFLLAWNLYLSMDPYFEHGPCANSRQGHQRCSAFIATGQATKDRNIVMGHNTHCGFDEASLSNILSYVYPDKGHAFMMQTSPGLIASSTDWFISSSGMMGCESTIGNFTEVPDFSKTPYFCRIRECMQYGTTMDDYLRIMQTSNAGDYACGWLFGDANTGEIAILELGKKKVAIERTFSGFYVGTNWVNSEELRRTETTETPSTQHGVDGAFFRNQRLTYLLKTKYWGKLDNTSAKTVLADHFGIYSGEGHGSGYSICRHLELEPNSMRGHTAYEPYGAVDGKVTTSKLAKQFGFWARWGSSCGRTFCMEEHVKKHPKYKSMMAWATNFSAKPWTKF